VKTEAAQSSKTLVSFCNTTQCHSSEDLDLNLYHRDNLTSRITIRKFSTFITRPLNKMETLCTLFKDSMKFSIWGKLKFGSYWSNTWNLWCKLVTQHGARCVFCDWNTRKTTGRLYACYICTAD